MVYVPGLFRRNSHTGHLKALNEDLNTGPRYKLYISHSFVIVSHKLHNATCIV